ncbi:MAG: hypothetical protein COS72_02875 [Candidatus Moranbacteria bacterium CG06_land_8_20_14_3_00_43_56]|nr:MAG: hypothetical protein COS72_02875 [Candidatus Moranbacteria bacterium CG06_land_8_20_14_3_00_43_56]PIV84486.1 MAG: hypothetical protein COW51_00195 [Candidatus Moranbacteria bacterium CG17_big_fil_post_rev_8_21_14_2_50_44_12]PIW93258.1 MAG: hypothetical protein COZ87_02255 [Candidatus Moranbacteria bacterium CG_4_8_14_3_um_filter_43_15]PJA85390.1 MAG: hypothetical protein CO142_04000 [Candidatus Moranbacteria bacterium CG_4_9_14_3_um_filter_44_28]
MQKRKLKPLSAKLFSPIKKLFDHKHKPFLHTIEWIFVLIAFFIIGLSVIYYQRVISFFEEREGFPSGSREAMIQTKEEEKLFTGEVVPEPIDTTAWDTYRNKWYGFEIQHPDTWKNNTQYKTATEKSAVYETIYKFRSDGEGTGSIFEGYDVKIYPVKKVPDIESTNDIHKKEGAPEDTSECQLAEEVSFGSGEVYFQKVSIKDGNLCYEPAYFYSITKGNYIYNIVPAVGESGERFSNPEKETTRLFPEYKEAVSAFKFISIVRPQPKPKPKITAQRPVSAKIANGRLVCAKKNNKPRKSKQNKGKHLDLECCLDPDEYPNPWCTY